MLIDFDQQFKKRFDQIQNKIPPELGDRVFALGVLSEPENLNRNLDKRFEDIGRALAQDCVDNTRELWGHDLLKHNMKEIDRMISSIKPFLFVR